MNIETNPQAPRRPGRPSLTNEQLLDKALDLFLEQGFERTSIEAICAAAGMAKRTVYARYGDKTSLFKAALQRAIEEWIVPVERLRAAEGADLEQSLLSVGGILLANIMSPAGLRLLRLTNAEIGPPARDRCLQCPGGYRADHCLSRRAVSPPAGRCRRPARSARGGRHFLHLVTGPGIDAAWGVQRDEAALARHIRMSVRLFLHGLLAPRSGEDEELLDNALAALDAAREQLLLAKAARPT